MEHLIPPIIFWLELPKKKTLTGEASRRRPNQMFESPPPLSWPLLTWRSSRSPLRAPSEDAGCWNETSQSSLAEFPIPPVMPLINSRYVCVGVADEIQIRLYSGEEMLLSWVASQAMKRFFSVDGGFTKVRIPSLKTDTGGLVKSVSPGRIIYLTGVANLAKCTKKM